jgi:hypothetical protein
MTEKPRTVPAVVRAGEGQTIEGAAGGPLAFKVRAENTNGALTAFENRIAPGDGPPLHVHANEDEAWYVIDGELRFRLDEEIAFPDEDARAALVSATLRDRPPGEPLHVTARRVSHAVERTCSNASGSKSAPSSRFSTCSRLRLKVAVTPAASL